MNNTFLKWAGGKNWLIKDYSYLIPKKFERYIDPFLGGGSVYFYLEPQKAILSDVNSELITTYLAIQKDWRKTYRKLQEHQRRHNDKYFYEIRSKHPREMTSIAARMIYLNRTCFNGIYRVNRNGEFNVPRGSKNNVLTGNEKFDQRSLLLKNALIKCSDFEQTIDEAKEGDLLFCDPPYAILDEQSFVGYTKDIFDWNDQIRLANALKSAKNRGVKILMTNVSHSSVQELYNQMDGFSLIELTRFSGVSGKSSGKKQYPELIISANL